MNQKIIILLLFSAVIFSACTEIPINNNINTETQIIQEPEKTIIEPINNAADRVSKKPFAIKISPSDSPISPEKFSGYHTGVDFEIFAEEKDSEINIYAICDGPLISKKFVSGYGGVAIQSCNLHDQDVTVIYGHLKLSSISAKLNQNLDQGQLIGILGQGFSEETDGERKHLHLGVHKGEEINLLGYVQTSNLLENWIDPLTYLNL